MKGNRCFTGFVLIALFGMLYPTWAKAQDDLFYEPPRKTRQAPPPSNNYGEQYSYDSESYDYDDSYYDDADYPYEYSSRIRRFHRPVRSADFFDPFYIDLWYYDPFFSPGISIYTYSYTDYWMWRRWNRWNRRAAWAWGNPYAGWGFSPWGWNTWAGPGWGFGGPGWGAPGWGWGNSFVWNNYFYDPYWVWNGYNPYCPNVWVNNNVWYNNNNYNGGNNGFRPQTYTGPRRHGSTVTPGYARIDDGRNGRLSPNVKDSPVIELNRPGRQIYSDREPAGTASDRGRTSPSRESRGADQGRQNEMGRQNDGARPSRDVERPSRDIQSRPARPSESAPSRGGGSDMRSISPDRGSSGGGSFRSGGSSGSGSRPSGGGSSGGSRSGGGGSRGRQ